MRPGIAWFSERQDGIKRKADRPELRWMQEGQLVDVLVGAADPTQRVDYLDGEAERQPEGARQPGVQPVVLRGTYSNDLRIHRVSWRQFEQAGNHGQGVQTLF